MYNIKKQIICTILVICLFIATVSMTACGSTGLILQKALTPTDTDSETDTDTESASETVYNSDDIEFRMSEDGILEWRPKDDSGSKWQPVTGKNSGSDTSGNDTTAVNASSQKTDSPISMRIHNGHLQWGYTNTNEWFDLISVDDLRDDTYGNIEFRIYDGYLQYGTGSDDSWTNIISTDEINITNNNYSVEAGTDFACGYTMRSVVSIISTFTVKNTYWGHTTTSEATSAGSGVIYKLNENTGEAYIITNYHVVYSSSADSGISDNINLYLYGSESNQYAIPAKYVGGSMTYDIAVLYVEKSDLLASGFAKAVDIGNSNEVYVGQNVIAVGNPEGSGLAVTSGIVNVDSEYLTIKLADEKTTGSMRVIRIDAAINPGNSGGGLFDANGKFIGITNAKAVDSTIDNVGYVIPSNIAVRIAQSIIDYCVNSDKTSAYRCLVGITVKADSSCAVYDEELSRAVINEVVSVEQVSDSGIAAGYLKNGDIINSVTINNCEYKVTRTFMIVDSMLTARVGDKVTFNITRDGVDMNIDITISESCVTQVS